jgi:hypothetical protein
MISSTSSPDRAPRADLVSAPGPSLSRPYSPRPDQISTESAAFLRGALERQPAIRPEVVERARALLADPTYPSTQVLKHVASQIIASPDLSEDES